LGKSTPFTYRYVRNQEFGEKHFDSAQQALERAIQDINNSYAEPVHIREFRTILAEKDQIYDAWEEKHLNGGKPTI
jgi:hypothetical protein